MRPSNFRQLSDSRKRSSSTRRSQLLCLTPPDPRRKKSSGAPWRTSSPNSPPRSRTLESKEERLTSRWSPSRRDSSLQSSRAPSCYLPFSLSALWPSFSNWVSPSRTLLWLTKVSPSSMKRRWTLPAGQGIWTRTLSSNCWTKSRSTSEVFLNCSTITKQCSWAQEDSMANTQHTTQEETRALSTSCKYSSSSEPTTSCRCSTRSSSTWSSTLCCHTTFSSDCLLFIINRASHLWS